jgi:serine phosphatase RsbU (regulator of sigma subunit)
VRNGLNQDTAESESDDGCDAMIMRIDREQRQIVFAGAKIGAFQLTPQGQVIRHLATRASLGYCQPPDPENEPIDQVITYTPGDAFVIVTDGFTDQIGGPIEQRSFGYRRIEQVLAQLATNSAQEIVDRLRYEFDEWCGASRIRDDLTVIAFRL